MVANSNTGQQVAYPSLGANSADRVTAGLRALASMVPFIGPVLAEVVTEIIPGQRLERLEKYLAQLRQELERRTLETAGTALSDPAPAISRRLKEPQNVDLIEDGARLAVRALSDERMRYIVHCVADGIDAEDHAKIHHKRLLSIIDELDDEEILILDAFGSRSMGKLDRLRSKPATIGAPIEVLNANALHDAAVAKLERLSLLVYRQRFRDIEIGDAGGRVIGRDSRYRSEKIKVPEIDAFGNPEGHREITILGRLVLTSIGLEVASMPVVRFTDSQSS